MALFVAGDDDDARTSGYAHALHASLPYAASFPRDWPFTAPKVPRCYSPLRRGAADPFDYGAPVVLERLADHWPACRTWTPAFFSRVMGHRTVPVEVGAHSNDFALQLMTVNEFLSRHIFQTAPGGATGYLAQHPLSSQVPLLQNDFAIPHVCESAPHVNVWIGPAGTLTPFHADPCVVVSARAKRRSPAARYRNVLVQIVGCKRVQLKQSQCDAAEDDVVLLGPGEALYIPDGWLHQVASLETSISLSFWWPPPLALPPPPPPRQTTQ